MVSAAWLARFSLKASGVGQMAIGRRRLRLARERSHGRPYCIGQLATTHDGLGKEG